VDVHGEHLERKVRSGGRWLAQPDGFEGQGLAGFVVALDEPGCSVRLRGERLR
jgi:hypothetical protein